MGKMIGGLGLLLFVFCSLQYPVEATAQTNVNSNCSESAKSLLKQAWQAQPQNLSPKNTADPRRAEALYKQALQDSPRCWLALQMLSSLLNRDGNYSQSYEYNALLLVHYPDDPNALQAKANLLTVWKKDHQGAIQIHKKLVAKNGPGNGSLYYNIAGAYSQMNRPDDSLEFLKLAMAIDKGWGDSGNAQINENFKNLRKDQRFWARVKK